MIATNPALTKETPKMIDLYTWPTPNGHKIHIMLEETGLPYNVIPIDINKGDQFDPEYLKLSPNNKMPAMVDTDGPGGEPYGLFESGAILMYLAEKTGQFMPAEMAARYRVIQWLMFQMGGIGPLFGQAHHFMFNPSEVVPYAQERYHKEAKRLYKVMNTQMQGNRYLAGDDYTVADIATFPWVDRFRRHQVDLAEFPNVKRWHEELWERPAVKKGMEVPFYNQ